MVSRRDGHSKYRGRGSGSTPKYTEAEQVFARTKQRDFPPETLRIPFFKPTDSDRGGPVLLTGRVVRVEVGFAFIEVAGKPHFYIPSSKYGGLVLKTGARVTFNPGFTARGQVALNPELEE